MAARRPEKIGKRMQRDRSTRREEKSKNRKAQVENLKMMACSNSGEKKYTVNRKEKGKGT